MSLSTAPSLNLIVKNIYICILSCTIQMNNIEVVAFLCISVMFCVCCSIGLLFMLFTLYFIVPFSTILTLRVVTIALQQWLHVYAKYPYTEKYQIFTAAAAAQGYLLLNAAISFRHMAAILPTNERFQREAKMIITFHQESG